ncbi:MAG: lipocalin-like domain-containing protein [Opitutales bacterium]
MRLYLLFSLFAVVSVSGEWIQPPLKTASGYPVPQPEVVPELPQAHGAHFGYGIEWWYWVGHLEAVDSGMRYGFQSTVFRLEGEPGVELGGGGNPGSRAANRQQPSAQDRAFGGQQLYMAHSALSDLDAGRYQHHERIFRGGWQAAASDERLDFSVGGIRARMVPGSEVIEMTVALEGGDRLELEMSPSKPLIAFGERGLSRKGADPAAVSWYWTYPRLALEGRLIRDGEPTAVKGTGWMDHEISSSQLGSDLQGWDWTAIQLDDGTEVKAYRLRRVDGTADPWSAVYWIDAAGKVSGVYAEGFSWEQDRSWTSSKTGNTYPHTVTIRAVHPESGVAKVYRLRPYFDGQEFVGNRGGNAYWEGACEVLNADGERIGRAYLELAGYGGGLGNRLTK